MENEIVLSAPNQKIQDKIIAHMDYINTQPHMTYKGQKYIYQGISYTEKTEYQPNPKSPYVMDKVRVRVWNIHYTTILKTYKNGNQKKYNSCSYLWAENIEVLEVGALWDKR